MMTAARGRSPGGVWFVCARPAAHSDEGAVAQRGPRAARLPRGERRSHVVFELWGLPRSETYNVCSDETEGETDTIRACPISPSDPADAGPPPSSEGGMGHGAYPPQHLSPRKILLR